MTAMSPVDQAGPPCASSAKPKHHTIALLRAAVLAIVMALSSLAATGVAAQESTPPDASPTPEITPAPDARRLELTLQELNDSGVSGTATLYDAGERTIVVIDAEGTGENHPSHIHAGRDATVRWHGRCRHADPGTSRNPGSDGDRSGGHRAGRGDTCGNRRGDAGAGRKRRDGGRRQ
jgi:hypothetical protein